MFPFIILLGLSAYSVPIIPDVPMFLQAIDYPIAPQKKQNLPLVDTKLLGILPEEEKRKPQYATDKKNFDRQRGFLPRGKFDNKR